MSYRHIARRAAAVAGATLWLCTAAPPAAQAHPLGNFSVNHYTGFTVRPDRLDVLAVTDTAEIPTLQAATAVDTDHDGSQSPAEQTAWAAARCAETAAHLKVTAPRRLAWTAGAATFTYRPGQAGLRTSRLECRLHSAVRTANGPLALTVDTGVDATRVGWNEITAKGAGTHLRQSTVPRSSVTDELRTYPRDLLATPLGATRAHFTAVAGDGASATTGTNARPTSAGGLTGRVEALSQHLTSLAGARQLTLPVGLLAVLLSIVLGAGHALLPGHGKTVMAVYLAGRRGRTRDAVTVGATVTITHTVGVLAIGLCLTTFSSLAGDTVMNWLGVTSGALVAVVGAVLLTDTVRRSRTATAPAAGPAVPTPQPALVSVAEPSSATTPADHDHSHGHPHGHSHVHDHDHGHDHPRHPSTPHRHGLLGHHHSHGPDAGRAQPFTTRGLVGLGVAGGLVPSPSALVVLLGAIALGRTVFGAALVLAYGLGMAATFTAVGLLLVRLGGKAERLAARPALARLRRISPYTAPLTATLVLIVGLGMMTRGLQTVL